VKADEMTPHKLELKSYQWGDVPGGRPEDAVTWFICSRCGKMFFLVPSIYQAAADQGFDLNHCEADDDEN
jgi:hypothetical protein